MTGCGCGEGVGRGGIWEALLETMGFCFKAGFFLGIRVSLVVVGRDRYTRTTRLTCSGVRGFDGREPEWVARGGVDGRSAMVGLRERILLGWVTLVLFFQIWD